MPSIVKLRVASYNLKEGPLPNHDPNFSHRQIGLIAENIAEVFPKCAVYEDDMVTPKSYRQDCVIALLVKGMQEQQQQIVYLKRQISARQMIVRAH